MLTDGSATRERKRKQIKAFKGKQRAAEMDAEQNAKKSSWQSFQSKAGLLLVHRNRDVSS